MRKNPKDRVLEELEALKKNKPDEYQQTVQRAKSGDVIDPEFAGLVLAADKVIRRKEKGGQA